MEEPTLEVDFKGRPVGVVGIWIDKDRDTVTMTYAVPNESDCQSEYELGYQEGRSIGYEEGYTDHSNTGRIGPDHLAPHRREGD